MIEYTVTLPAPARLLTVNAERKMNHFQRAQIVRQWRTLSRIMAQACRVPHFDHIGVAVHIEQARGRLADPLAHMPVAKACIDGLVDAKVIDDDSAQYVSPEIHAPMRGIRDLVTLTIQPVGEPTPAPKYSARDLLEEMQGRAAKIANEQRRCPHPKRLSGVCIECGHGA